MGKYNKWVTLLGGYLGIHRYMVGEIGTGLLYTCTFGLFGIGWFVDTVKAFSQSASDSKTLSLPHHSLRTLPVVHPDGIVLNDDELCHYHGNAYTEKSSSRVSGYVSQHTGGSVRIAKGLSLHQGASEREAIRETVTERSKGILYITSKRIIFIAPKDAFDKPFSSLSAYVPNQGHISLLFGNQSVDLITSDSYKIRNIIDGVLNGIPTE